MDRAAEWGAESTAVAMPSTLRAGEGFMIGGQGYTVTTF